MDEKESLSLIQQSSFAPPDADDLQDVVYRKMRHIRTVLGRTNLPLCIERYYASKRLNQCLKLDTDVLDALKHCSGVEIVHAIGAMKKISGEKVHFHFYNGFFLWKQTNITYSGAA